MEGRIAISIRSCQGGIVGEIAVDDWQKVISEGPPGLNRVM